MWNCHLLSLLAASEMQLLYTAQWASSNKVAVESGQQILLARGSFSLRLTMFYFIEYQSIRSFVCTKKSRLKVVIWRWPTVQYLNFVQVTQMSTHYAGISDYYSMIHWHSNTGGKIRWDFIYLIHFSGHVISRLRSIKELEVFLFKVYTLLETRDNSQFQRTFQRWLEIFCHVHGTGLHHGIRLE